MYDFIRGKLYKKSPSEVVIDVQGVGYQISIPLNVLSKMPDPGHEVLLHTAFIVKENSQALYGFLETSQKELFLLLIDISGIGPKTALSLIGHLSLDLIEQAVATQEIGLLIKVPGIGKKTAERLILELKGKWSGLPPSLSISLSGKEALFDDAKKALMNLGYPAPKVSKAIEMSLNSLPDGVSISSLITHALSLIR